MRRWFRFALRLALTTVLWVMIQAGGFQTARCEALAPAATSLDKLLARYDLYSGNLTLSQIDFSTVELLQSEDALHTFLLNCHDALVRQVPVRLPPWVALGVMTESKLFYDWESMACDYYEGSGEYLITFNMTPGAKIAQAFLARDTSRLTQEEMRVYLQVEVFFKVVYPWNADAVTRERSIHDYICGICEYWTDDGEYAGSYEDFRSVVGVFIDGKANCSGVTDAFHMLSRIAGFQTRKVFGEMRGVPHAWNAILLNGAWYMVDATNNGQLSKSIPYEFFNVGVDMMASTHIWEDPSVPIAQQTNMLFAYGNPAFEGYERVPDMKTLYDTVLNRAKQGPGIRQTLLCDLFVGNVESFLESLSQELSAALGLYRVNVAYQHSEKGMRLFLDISITY